MKKAHRKKDPTITYNIPLLSIPQEIKAREKDRYPEQLTISLRSFKPEPKSEKIYHVGGIMKNKMLELHADDIQLANWIQTRASQIEKTHIRVDRNFLIMLAHLLKTDSTNKTVANKSLIKKLKRLCNRKIILEVPEAIREKISLKVR